MPSIPVYVVEEHHEVFFAWHYAIQHGILAASGNALLHIDEHADIGTPRLHRPLPPVGTALDEVRQFTYQELACFEFIVPAIYQGIFSDLVWIHGRPARKSDQSLVVRTLDGRAMSFDVSGGELNRDGTRVAESSAPDGHARYFVRTVDDPVPTIRPIVLDIDLDYLSCEDAVNLVQRIEVTRDEFESFQHDRYHFLRVTQGSRIRVSAEGDRYYMYLRNYPERLPTPLRVSEDEIVRRLDALVRFVARLPSPQLIAIARSRLSGYTPADQWQFIETALITRLRTLFELDVHTIDDILASVDRDRSGRAR